MYKREKYAPELAYLPRHDLLLQHTPYEVGRLQSKEAEQELLGLVFIIVPRLLLNLLSVRLNSVLNCLLPRPKYNELDEGREERLASSFRIVLLPRIPARINFKSPYFF